MKHPTPEWRAFQNAKTRCSNPNYCHWKDYGGRGIEFRFKSFEEFYEELGPRPKGMILDRKDNDGHYETGNVQWETRSQSNRNRRKGTEAQRRCGRIGNHYRWHVAKGIKNSNCELCHKGGDLMYAKKKTLKLPPAEARWLDLKAAAAYLSCSVSSLRRLIRSGELQAVPGFRHHTVDKNDLDTLMIRRKKVLPPYRVGNRPDIAQRHARNRKAA